MTITDVASGMTDTVEFKGTLSGPVTVGNPAACEHRPDGEHDHPRRQQHRRELHGDRSQLPAVGPVVVGGTSTGGIGLHVRAIPRTGVDDALEHRHHGPLGMIRRRRKATV